MTSVTEKMGSFSFDHVGIAVSSIQESIGFYEALGIKDITYEEVASEGVRVAMLQLANSSKLELLEPLGEDGPIHKFLQKKGPGVHHICLRVDDIQSVIERLKLAEVKLINDVPRKGAHNMLVVFVHPKSTGGVLLEISQPQSTSSVYESV